MPSSCRARFALLCIPSSVRRCLWLALLLGRGPASGQMQPQPLPPTEPASVSGGAAGATPGSLPSEPMAPEPELIPPSQPLSPPATPVPAGPPPLEPAPPVPPPLVESLPAVPHPAPTAATQPSVFETRVEAPAPTSAASAETI